jgi:predicted transcriptional regulator
VKTIGKAKVFESAITRDQAQTRLVDDLLSLFGGDVKPVMARLVDSGKITMDHVKEVEAMVREQKGRKK